MPLASLDIGWFGEHGTLLTGGRAWELGREGWASGEFFLKGDGRRSATAAKPSAFLRSFRVDLNGDVYTWEADSAFTRSFVLREGSRVVGSMRPEHPFTRRTTIDLPSGLSLEHRAFLVWLALVLWRRQRHAS